MQWKTDNYTAEEVMAYQEAFQVTADRYRRLTRIVLLTIFSSVGIILGATFWNGFSLLLSNRAIFTPDAPWYIGGGALVCLVVGGIAAISRPALRCPACGKRLNVGIGRYCPECGSDRLGADVVGRPCCRDCGVVLWTAADPPARPYAIRVCTSCGLPLDFTGL